MRKLNDELHNTVARLLDTPVSVPQMLASVSLRTSFQLIESVVPAFI